MKIALRTCLGTLLFIALGTDGTKVTPMQKVVTLLKDLSAKVAAEGKKEAAAYDKYACFCKEQADEKLYSIEKSDEKIARLKAEISELDGAIALLNSEVGDLSKKITELEGKISDMTEKRNGEHVKYEAKAKDMNEAIAACAAAIEALKNSKSAMKGAKLDFAQVKKATASLPSLSELTTYLTAVSQKRLLANAPGVLALLSELGGKAAPKFEYQSNDIIATLESLLQTFKEMKKDLDTEEFDINSNYESNKLGLSNEKKFAEKERGEKEALVEKKTEQLEGAKSDRDAEQKDRDSDDAFMKELTNDCEHTATTFDQRSTTRSEELSTLTQAIETLESGAQANYAANKKLVGVEMKAVLKRKAVVQPASFFQVSDLRHDQSRKEKVLQRVISFLHEAAGKVGSAELANVATRAKVAEDHFVKVRALIKDLVKRLEDDAKAEASQKSFCDKNMKKAVTDRDTASGNIESASAELTTLTANRETLEKDIQTLEEGIAGLKKEMLEATELRNEAKADNEKGIQMSDEGIEAVKSALELLQEFYSNAKLMQIGRYVPPKSDRDGNTLGDLAPDVFKSDYKGSQESSKGIIGILEVILSDFERTNGKTKEDEKSSEEEFAELEKDLKSSVEEKEKSIKEKEGTLDETKASILEQEQALSEAKDLLESSEAKLEDLTLMCVKGEESWEERKKKREEEIEALKDAMEILNNWQD